jgi:hypothetical protein
MKNQKKTIIILAALAVVLILSSFYSGENETKYLTVRTIEFYGGVFDSKIVIVDENGTIQEKDLEKMRSKTLGENARRINEVLNNLSSKGYSLASSSASGFGTDGLVNLYIFQKKLAYPGLINQFRWK